MSLIKVAVYCSIFLRADLYLLLSACKLVEYVVD